MRSDTREPGTAAVEPNEICSSDASEFFDGGTAGVANLAAFIRDRLFMPVAASTILASEYLPSADE